MNASYLIKSHNIYSSAEIDVLGVKAIDSLLLESFLTFAQLRWNLDDLVLVIVGHGGVSLKRHFTSLDEESIS